MTTHVNSPHSKYTPGVSAYANGRCRCNTCRTAWREYARKKTGGKPSLMAQHIEQLTQELELLREENAALRCHLDELEP